jgi:hypothetical protein
MQTMRGYAIRLWPKLRQTSAGWVDRPICLIERATPEGQQAGLRHDAVVSCNNLATVYEDRIDRIIGYLPAALMSRIDECLKAALGLL